MRTRPVCLSLYDLCDTTVVIVLDAETQNATEIQEKISLANTLLLLLPAAPLDVPFKVLLVLPTIASILTSVSETQSQRSFQPNFLEAIEHFTPFQIQILQQHPLIQELIKFSPVWFGRPLSDRL